MPVTNMHYKSFSQIGIGDKVRHKGEEYMVMVRSDEHNQLILVTDNVSVYTSNWQDLEVLSLMNE